MSIRKRARERESVCECKPNIVRAFLISREKKPSFTQEINSKLFIDCWIVGLLD